MGHTTRTHNAWDNVVPTIHLLLLEGGLLLPQLDLRNEEGVDTRNGALAQVHIGVRDLCEYGSVCFQHTVWVLERKRPFANVIKWIDGEDSLTVPVSAVNADHAQLIDINVQVEVDPTGMRTQMNKRILDLLPTGEYPLEIFASSNTRHG